MTSIAGTDLGTDSELLPIQCGQVYHYTTSHSETEQ